MNSPVDEQSSPLAETSAEPSTEKKLRRQLGLSSSFSMITGSMLGIGIFLAPCLAARHINTSGLFFGAWIFTGMIALTGAWIYGKLGVMLPKSGGDYIFHREALGPSVAFSYGWGLLSSAFAGSMAAMAVALCTYQLLPLFNLPTGELISFSLATGLTFTLTYAQLSAVALIFLLTLSNSYGLALSAKLQEVVAFIPLIALFVMCGFLFTCEPVEVAKSSSYVESWSYSGISNAFLEIYFAYSGWNAIIYVAGEVKNPQKTIPLALIGGTITVMCLYLFFCAAALHYVGLEGLRGFYDAQTDLGTGIAKQLGGGLISQGMTTLVTIALLASINATVIGGGRLAYMMSKDGCFWEAAHHLHPKYQTPNRAMWIISILASMITLTVPYDLIFRLISLVMVLGGILTAISYYILKHKKNHHERTFTPADWILPPLFICSSLLVILAKIDDVFSNQEGAWPPLLGLIFISLIYIFHLFYKRLSNKSI